MIRTLSEGIPVDSMYLYVCFGHWVVYMYATFFSDVYSICTSLLYVLLYTEHITIIRKLLMYKICLDYVMYVCKRVTMPIPLVSIPIIVFQRTQGLPSVQQSILILLS